MYINIKYNPRGSLLGSIDMTDQNTTSLCISYVMYKISELLLFDLSSMQGTLINKSKYPWIVKTFSGKKKYVQYLWHKLSVNSLNISRYKILKYGYR